MDSVIIIPALEASLSSVLSLSMGELRSRKDILALVTEGNTNSILDDKAKILFG